MSKETKKDIEENKKQDEKSQILEGAAKEYYSSGEDELKKERYNSSVVLFFKALVAFVDLYIYQKTGKTPSSHKERFRVAQNNFAEVYNLLDKDFPFYQDSYIQTMSRELAEVIEDDAKTMAEKVGVKL